MCGFVGIISNQQLKIDNQFTSSLKLIQHRGPDYSNIWISDNKKILFGHNRLSIVDLTSKGNQPMFYNKTSIIFNGEIYNFIELKKRLESKGYSFKSDTDTEIILAAYDFWGEECLKEFVGMFAFCIYDIEKNKVFLCRDRTGEKPLYYSLVKNKLYFASELKSLYCFQEINKKINKNSFDYFLSAGFSPSEDSLIDNIKKLPAGYSISYNIENSKYKIKKYWNIDSKLRKNKFINSKDQIDNFYKIFQKSVDSQLNCDVPLGVLLSGGLDSSLVTAFASNTLPGLNTFNVAYKKYAKYDESNYANEISKFFKTNHHELIIDDVKPEILEKICSIYDEPIIDSSAIPTFLIFNEAKKYCKVVIGGDGGDELFGGYSHYNKILLLRKIKKLLPFLPYKKISNFFCNNLSLGSKGRHWLKLLDINLNENLPIVPIFFDKFEKNNLLLKKNLDIDIFTDNYLSYKNTQDLIFDNTFENFKNYLTENLLVKIDRASMANSLEVRSPFLDKNLIEFAFYNLCSKNKVSYINKKIFLKKIASNILPNNFDLNRKQGFVIPLNEWLKKGKWKDFFYDALMSSDCFFDKKYIEKLFDFQKKGYQNGERLYGLVMISMWLKKYKITY